MSRKSVNESGYQYRKGKSRSKLLNPEETSDTDTPSDSAPKRKIMTCDARLKRITELQDTTKDLNDQIGFKEKRREVANNIKNYKECERITEEMSDLKSQKRKLETELALLTKKQQKSIWYQKRKRGVNSHNAGSDSRDSHPSRKKARSLAVDGTSTSTPSFKSSSPVSSVSHMSETLSASEFSDNSQDDTVILSSDEDSTPSPKNDPSHSCSSKAQYFQ